MAQPPRAPQPRRTPLVDPDGHRQRIEGPVTFTHSDDDRVSEAELGFAGVLAGACPECATPVRELVRLTVARSRADGSGSLKRDVSRG